MVILMSVDHLRALGHGTLDLSEPFTHDVQVAPDEADWRRLATQIARRRRELGMTQREVQEAGGPSVATLRNLEAGTQDSYQGVVLGRLEQALRWRVGSVEATLAGGDPTPVGSNGEPAQSDADWAAKLQRVRQIANNPDRSPGLRAWAAAQEAQIEQILQAARQEEDAQRRSQAS